MRYDCLFTADFTIKVNNKSILSLTSQWVFLYSTDKLLTINKISKWRSINFIRGYLFVRGSGESGTAA